VYFSNNAGTLSTNNFEMANFLDSTVVPLVSVKTVITLLLVVVAHFLMIGTEKGKNYYLVGGNPETAWFAGLHIDRYLVIAFMLSGLFAAIGGALFAAGLGAAMANIAGNGINPLMIIIAATLLGGASLAGGCGRVINSFFGVATLTVLFNGLNYFKAGYEVQILICGIILMIVILIESISLYRKHRMEGAIIELLEEKTNKADN